MKWSDFKYDPDKHQSIVWKPMHKNKFAKLLATIMMRALLVVVLFGVNALWWPGSPAAGEPGEQAEKPEGSEQFPLAPRSLLLDAVSDGQGLVAVGERGHVLLSDDSGSTWEQVPVPTRSLLTALTSAEAGNLWAVGHDAAIIHSHDGGKTWSLQFFAPEGQTPLFDVWFENKNHGIAVGAYGLFLETQNGGKTWEKRSVDDEERHWYAITQGPDGTLYVAAEFGVVFRSRDKGKTWEVLQTPYEGTFFGDLALRDGTLLIFGLRGNVYRSTDNGKTWQHIQTGTYASLMNGLQLKNGTVVIAGLSGTLLLSRDDGKSFRLINRPDRLGISAMLETGPGKLLLFGEEGVKHGLSEN